MTDFTGVTRIEINESAIRPPDIDTNIIGLVATVSGAETAFRAETALAIEYCRNQIRPSSQRHLLRDFPY